MSNHSDVQCHHSCLGLDQSGIAATIASSIAQLPEEIQGLFWANIGLIGGNTKFPGFRERLCVPFRILRRLLRARLTAIRMSELRTLGPVDCEVVLYLSTEYGVCHVMMMLLANSICAGQSHHGSISVCRCAGQASRLRRARRDARRLSGDGQQRLSSQI